MPAKRMLSVMRGALDIKCPLIPGGLWSGNPLEVTTSSPRVLRKAVYEMAWYFKRELHFDFVQYGRDGVGEEKDHVAFLWLHPHSLHLLTVDEFLIPAVGACCFRWRDYSDAEPAHAMQWIWIHPFFRNEGLLSEAWPMLEKRFGDFICEGPLSYAMERFLRGVDGEFRHGWIFDEAYV